MTTTINASNSGSGGLIQTADASGVLALQTAGTTAVTVNASQNVGIGTSSPSTKLHVVSSSGENKIISEATAASQQASLSLIVQAATPGQTVIYMGKTGATTNGQLGYDPNTNAMTMYTNNTERMRIDSSGNVGIGTSSPSKKLEVYAASNSLQIESIVRNDQAGSGVAAIGFNVSSGAAAETTSTKAGIGLVRSNSYGVGSLCFYNNGTTSASDFTTADERMRIDSSGNVLVGAASGGGKLSITGTGSSGWVQNNINSGTASTASIVFTNDNGAVGSILTSGSLTSYSTSSDYRLKEDIAPMTGALAKVALLKPCTYKWKVDGSDGQGFIAHELDEVVPGCVTGEKDAVETYTDEDGNEATRPVYQGIDTSFLVATLTAAIQELTARIAALEGTPA